MVVLALISIAAACSVDGAQAPKSTAQVEGNRGGSVRPDKARIPPVEKQEWTESQRAYLGPFEQQGRLANVFKTLARHPELAQTFQPAYEYINEGGSTLPPRHRELLILRIGWLCGSEYEWAAHSAVAHSLGFTAEELRRVTRGPDAPGWAPFEAALLRAADELHRDAFIKDATWQALSTEYDSQQLMDLVFTVGTYNMVAMALNSWGVQLDPGWKGFPRER